MKACAVRPPSSQPAGRQSSTAAPACAGPSGLPGPRADCSAAAPAATVVATGGCFDLLHAGHVETLRAARALGDRLVVCLNSDASVRRLKGPGRPLVPETDRARVLLALECVDEVVVFDEDTPVEVLRRIRPDIWTKGGDYAGAELPELAVLEEWGGQAVVLPYVEGRSTTALVEAVTGRAADRRPLWSRPPDEGVRDDDVDAGDRAGDRRSIGTGRGRRPRRGQEGGRPLVLDRGCPTRTVDLPASDVGSSTSPMRGRPRLRCASSSSAPVALDAVVTCAGTDACGRFDDVDGDDWDRVVQVNLIGTAAVVRAALPGCSSGGGRS